MKFAPVYQVSVRLEPPNKGLPLQTASQVLSGAGSGFHARANLHLRWR